MCGRYVSRDQAVIERAWNLKGGGSDPFGPRYNAAPTQRLPIVRVSDQGNLELKLLRWGLIPSWAKDPSIGVKMINARGETVAEKPAFRAAFKRRRCLVPMAGFYEWQKTPAGKMPHFIHPLNSGFWAIAGLYEWWPGKDGAEPIESYTIITTEANEMMANLHDRMPVILHKSDFDAWLDPMNNDGEALKRLIKPCGSEEMRAYRVVSRSAIYNEDSSALVSTTTLPGIIGNMSIHDSTPIAMGSPPAGNQINCPSDNSCPAIAVLISHGANGYGAWMPVSGLRITPTPDLTAGAPEDENRNNTNLAFVQRSPNDTDNPDTHFDDILVWVSSQDILEPLQKYGGFKDARVVTLESMETMKNSAISFALANVSGTSPDRAYALPTTGSVAQYRDPWGRNITYTRGSFASISATTAAGTAFTLFSDGPSSGVTTDDIVLTVTVDELKSLFAKTGF